MRPVSVAVVRAGVVSKEALSELQRWGLPVEILLEEEVKDASTPQQVAAIIQDALDSEDQTALRDTDLDIIKLWLDPANQQHGRLHLPLDGKKASVKVTFCHTRLGEYIIPWSSESIADLILTPESSLRFTTEAGEKKKIHFLDVRELFVGDHKAFMVCSGEEV